MTPEQIQELIDKLFSIAGAVASKGWELAIRQVYVQVVGDAIVVVLAIAGAVLCFRFAKLAAEITEARDARYLADHEVGYGIASVMAGAFALALPFAAYDLAAKLINPEWYAVKLLLGFVGR